MFTEKMNAQLLIIPKEKYKKKKTLLLTIRNTETPDKSGVIQDQQQENYFS